jgi:hypothetical protein
MRKPPRLPRVGDRMDLRRDKSELHRISVFAMRRWCLGPATTAVVVSLTRPTALL